MTFDQIAICTILLAQLVAYATERFRVEHVALAGLAAAFALGLVSARGLFAGFANPAVITVIEILLVVAALSRTRLLERVADRILATAAGERGALAILCTSGAALSVFMNNIGALALLFPVALSVAQRLSLSPARLLMPLSFACLLGGMCSLTGTPANLVVNGWLVRETGAGLGYFELGRIGGPLVLAGLAWLVFGSPRVLARYAVVDGTGEGQPATARLLVERRVSAGSAFAGLSMPAIEDRTGLEVHAVVRDGEHVFARRDRIVLQSGDILLVEGSESAQERPVVSGELEPVAAGGPATERFVVMPDSIFVGSRIEDIEAHGDDGLIVTGLARRLSRTEGRLRDQRVATGDVVALSGDAGALARIGTDTGLLPISGRRTSSAERLPGLSVALFLGGVLLAAFGIAPVEVAFGAVVLALIVTGCLDLRAALQDFNWSIVVLLACMIPLGLAVEDTGAARVFADAMAEGLAGLGSGNEGLAVFATMLLLAIAITPFVDNVSTAVILSPVATGLATRSGVPLEPALIAVAIGASTDFVTPFGHHNNAVVMGAGGYRFSDFPRLGLPLAAICVMVALIAFALVFA